MKNKYLFLVLLVLMGVSSSQVAAQDASSFLKSLNDLTKKIIEPTIRQENRVEALKKIDTEQKTTALSIAKVPAAESIHIFRNSNDVEKIPRSDEDRAEEYAEFKKNWKNKLVTFYGKVNRAGGVSIDEYHIDGCNVALQKIKLGSAIVVNGILESRESGGSGGEPVGISKCTVVETGGVTNGMTNKQDAQALQSIRIQQETSGSLKNSSTSGTIKNSVEDSAFISSNQSISKGDIGHLKGQIKVFAGAGCTYINKDEDKKGLKSKSIAADDADYKGLILNLGGNDVLFKEISRSPNQVLVSFNNIKLYISNGKTKSCGEECSKTIINFEFQQDSAPKIIVPVARICGS